MTRNGPKAVKKGKRHAAMGRVKVSPPSPLRGLVPTPRQVTRIVERSLKDRPASPAARRRITEGLKMQFYFGGHAIAYRETRQGHEVLAVGPDEIASLLKTSSDEQLQGVVFGHGDIW
jgi:hypothetical protein